MANTTEKKYVDGLFVETKETSFGEIIKLSVQSDKLQSFLNTHKNEKGYVNIDILTAKDGNKKYAVLNSFKPKAQVTEPEDDSNDLPF